jgi:MFS superfamily sulfate permease-like transporter
VAYACVCVDAVAFLSSIISLSSSTFLPFTFRLAVMAGWFQVFQVDSFVFFGTANTLYQQLKAHIKDQKATKPRAERTKYLIFDLTEVTGIDSSARDVFFKVHRLLKSEGINLVWAITNPKVMKAFDDQGLYVGAKHFISLDLALRHVEDELLRRAHHLSEKWLVNGTVRDIFQRQGEKESSPGN